MCGLLRCVCGGGMLGVKCSSGGGGQIKGHTLKTKYNVQTSLQQKTNIQNIQT